MTKHGHCVLCTPETISEKTQNVPFLVEESPLNTLFCVFFRIFKLAMSNIIQVCTISFERPEASH